MHRHLSLVNTKLFSLGNLFVSDFSKPGSPPREGRQPLDLVFEEKTQAMRLETVTDPDKMYGQYWYRSGINSTMTNELKSIALELPTLIPINKGDIFLDIACNDGTLLKFVPNKMITIGIDPVDDSYYNESSQVADLIIQEYFSARHYKNGRYGSKSAKIITIIGMFYDIPNPVEFLQEVETIMDDEGLLVIQMSYTPLMLKQLAFDNICHEHIYYYSLTSIQRLGALCGLRVVDCKLNDINGGSFRVYMRKSKANIRNFKSSPHRDVANYRIDSILNLERSDQITTPAPYLEFWGRIQQLKKDTVAFIEEAKSKGKTIWGYGASTKGNTLLQWYGLNHTLIDAIAERSPYKFGLQTVGTGIPILSEEEMRKVQPDYLLILPWHFIHEFRQREVAYLKKGGNFIVPCPQLEIISGCQG